MKLLAVLLLSMMVFGVAQASVVEGDEQVEKESFLIRTSCVSGESPSDALHFIFPTKGDRRSHYLSDENDTSIVDCPTFNAVMAPFNLRADSDIEVEFCEAYSKKSKKGSIARFIVTKAGYYYDLEAFEMSFTDYATCLKASKIRLLPETVE